MKTSPEINYALAFAQRSEGKLTVRVASRREGIASKVRVNIKFYNKRSHLRKNYRLLTKPKQKQTSSLPADDINVLRTGDGTMIEHSRLTKAVTGCALAQPAASIALTYSISMT